MPGELDMYKSKDTTSDKQKEQLNKAMKAPIDQDRIRKAGW